MGVDVDQRDQARGELQVSRKVLIEIIEATVSLTSSPARFAAILPGSCISATSLAQLLRPLLIGWPNVVRMVLTETTL